MYQQIKEKFQLGPATHITHITNLAGIVTNGLQSHNLMLVTSQKYFDLSDPSVQLGREQKIIPATGKNLHDYVPLYFGWKPPMLFTHQDKFEEIIYLRFSLNILTTHGAVISDGNARSHGTSFYLFSGFDDLTNLNVKAINDVKWSGDSEKKRQKQAEILIPNLIPFSQVLDIICYSPRASKQVVDILQNLGITKTVRDNSGWYYVPQTRF